VILVDTSAWIDFFQGIRTSWTKDVAHAARLEDVVVGDLILVELLQGVRQESGRRQMIEALSQYRRENLCGFAIAEAAAANYRLLRSRGIAVRGTIDVVIATWCLENDAAIIHNDRDLAAMEGLLGLRAYR